MGGESTNTWFDLICTMFLRVVSVIPESEAHRSHSE